MILTKMMRGDDAQDLSDIRFLVGHDRVTPAQMEEALADVVLPELPELLEAFAKAKPRVIELVRQPAH